MNRLNDTGRIRLAALADVLIPAAEGALSASEAGIAGPLLEKVEEYAPERIAVLRIAIERPEPEPTAALVGLAREDRAAYDAFVEECFPPEAMTDPGAFFAAVGDASLLKSNLAAMMDSCRKFLDFTRNDIVPTSQFDFAKEN